MNSKQIRSNFLDYFKKQGHTPVASSSLVPENDPTLLFTNAGMNQFKSLFLGLEKRSYTRAASSQKCVRAGGKHNDLENVGHTARHHTFFEMLGNFSFGDYFKKEAIHFAWHFITKELGLPKDRLYVSVFESDDEAADLWHKQEGVPRDRIYRFGEKDNFWRMGDSGPCGPCSEIFYDLGPEVGGDPKANVMGGEGDRFIEFWNLVFMQYVEDGKGGREKLPNPSVDTGMGLERLTTILQGKTNNYHTDVFLPLMATASKLSGVEYVEDINKSKGKEKERLEKQNVALRVLADHARATAFLIGDGVLPSNEGRGYVLRRIMRRAIRYGRQISTDTSLLPAVVESVIAQMGDVYSELNQQKSLIVSTTRDEESRFLSTLDQGTQILSDELKRLESKGLKQVDGSVAFKLYDTFGFPLDLTHLMARERGFSVDEAEFEKRMEQAREKARASWKTKSIPSDTAHLIKISQDLSRQKGPTQFKGYETTSSDGELLLLSDGQKTVKELKAGQSGVAAFSNTPFYAEGGGQVGDIGKVTGSHGQAEVLDCTKQGDIHLHHIRVVDGHFTLGDACVLTVTESTRRSTANNHSATHLLHAALRKVLGTHVTQAGSLVDAERLRFDFTHNKALRKEEIQAIEDLVNEQISRSLEVKTEVMEPKKAIEAGALALFGEKYGDRVRVLTMGDFSVELCGGTHVKNTAMIRLFKIVNEGSVSSGVRRIEAITGDRAVEYLLCNTRENLQVREATGLQENWSQYLERPAGQISPVVEWIEKTREESKNLQRQLQSAKGNQVDLDGFIHQAGEIKANGASGKLVLADLDMDDRKLLSEISDKLRDRIQSGVVVVVGKGEDSHPIIVSVSKNLVGKVHAGNILKDMAETMGGKGGGRPDFAQGAGKDRSKLADAFAKIRSSL